MDEYMEQESSRLINSTDVENLEQWLGRYNEMVQTGYKAPAMSVPPQPSPLKKDTAIKEPVPVVVHPNNFCPCGSGKKFKKCCMPVQQKDPT